MATRYDGPWPPGSLVAFDARGALVATWDGQAWRLSAGGSAPAGGLSRTLGYTPPDIHGLGDLRGVRWDASAGAYVRADAPAPGAGPKATATAPQGPADGLQLDTLVPADYGGGRGGVGDTVGGAVGGIVGGALGGSKTGEQTQQVGSLVGQGVEALVKWIGSA